MSVVLPSWASEMRDLFKSGSVAQFILNGNIFDLVQSAEPSGMRLRPLKTFLDEVMFGNYDVVLHYDRGRGIRASRGNEDWGRWLNQTIGDQAFAMAQLREPGSALELLDRYILRNLNLQSLGGSEELPHKIAVIIDYAEFVVPRGDPATLGALGV